MATNSAQQGVKIRYAVQNVPPVWDPYLPRLKDYQENYKTDDGIPTPQTFLVRDLEWLAMYDPGNVFTDPKVAADIGAEEISPELVKKYAIKPYSQVVLDAGGNILRVDRIPVTDTEAMLKRRLRIDIKSKNSPRARYANERIPFDAFGDPGLRLFEAYVPSGYGQKKQILAPMEGRKSSTMMRFVDAAYKIALRRKDVVVLNGLLEERSEDAGEMEEARDAILAYQQSMVLRAMVLSATLDDGPEATVRIGMALLHMGARAAEAGFHAITFMDSFTRYVQALSETLEEKVMTSGADKGTILSGGMRYKAIPLARALVDRFFGNFAHAGYGSHTGIMTGITEQVGVKRDPNANSMEHGAARQIGRGTHTSTLALVKHAGPFKHVKFQLDLTSMSRHADQLRTARQQAEFEHLERIKLDALSSRPNPKRRPPVPQDSDEDPAMGGMMMAVADMNDWAEQVCANGGNVPDYEYLTEDYRLVWSNVPGEENRNHK